MLECNWGDEVELPEYKIRPKRPMNPSLSLDTAHSNDVMIDSDTSKRLNNLVRHVSGSVTCQNLRSISNSASSSSISNANESLHDSQWYWSDLSRDDTILVLKNCPDGSFLVRNSSDRAQSAPYTLCVMKGTFVKSIKIFKQEQQNAGVYFYDIEKPCRFESVQALIAYYSRVSLKEYNHNLDLVLTYGVSKYKFGKFKNMRFFFNFLKILSPAIIMNKKNSGYDYYDFLHKIFFQKHIQFWIIKVKVII